MATLKHASSLDNLILAIRVEASGAGAKGNPVTLAPHMARALTDEVETLQGEVRAARALSVCLLVGVLILLLVNCWLATGGAL